MGTGIPWRDIVGSTLGGAGVGWTGLVDQMRHPKALAYWTRQASPTAIGIKALAGYQLVKIRLRRHHGAHQKTVVGVCRSGPQS